jgi:hypothetical protein
MDLLHTNLVAIINTIIINYPCLPCQKTWKQNYWKYLSSISFPCSIPVNLWVTHNSFKDIEHSTTHTSMPLSVTHRSCHSSDYINAHSSSPVSYPLLTLAWNRRLSHHSQTHWPLPQQHSPTTDFTFFDTLYTAVHFNTSPLLTHLWFQHPLNNTILLSSHSKFILLWSQQHFWKIWHATGSAYSLLSVQ